MPGRRLITRISADGLSSGAEKVSLARRQGVSVCPCGRPTRGRQPPRPLDPGLPSCPPAAARSLRCFRISAGPPGRAIPGAARLSPTSCRLIRKSLIRSAVGKAAQNSRFDICSKTNRVAASDAGKAFWLITVHLFLFLQAFQSSVLIAHVNNRRSQSSGKTFDLTGVGFQEASGALRKEWRPGRSGRDAAQRTAAPGKAHPAGPSGRSE